MSEAVTIHLNRWGPAYRRGLCYVVLACLPVLRIFFNQLNQDNRSLASVTGVEWCLLIIAVSYAGFTAVLPFIDKTVSEVQPPKTP